MEKRKHQEYLEEEALAVEKTRDTNRLFQLQMRISFTFLHAKHLGTSLLITRTRSFVTLLYVGGAYAQGR